MFIHFLMVIVRHILPQGMFSVLCVPAGYEKMSKIIFKDNFFRSFKLLFFNVYYYISSRTFLSRLMFLLMVVCVDAGGVGSCGVCETDLETAVLRLADLQPRRHQNIPSPRAG